MGAQAVLVDDEQLAGLDLADHAGADGGQRGVLAGDHPAALEPAEHQRADALRVAGGVERVLVHPDEGVGAAQLRQQLDRALLDGLADVVGQQRGDDPGVVGGLVGSLTCSSSSPSSSPRSSTICASSVVLMRLPLWASAIDAVDRRVERRLGVVPGARPRWSSSGVTDGDVALEGLQRGLVEDLRDQAHVLVDQDLPAVAHRDAGRLLAAVLEGVEPEVGQLGDVLARRPDPEDAAGVLRALVVGVEWSRRCRHVGRCVASGLDWRRIRPARAGALRMMGH